MFKKRIKKFLILSLIGFLLFSINQKTFAQIEEPLFSLSLNFQKIIQNIFQKFFKEEKDVYKEKYFELLKELAQLKLSLPKEKQLIDLKEKYQGKIFLTDVLKRDNFGYFYIKNFPEISEGMIVLDENWVLIGKVIKVFKNYSIVETLNVPGIEFKVNSGNGELLGLARTISNGFLEINFVDPKIKLKENEFVFTAGDEIFPANFLIGTIFKVYQDEFNQKIIVKLSFDNLPQKVILIKK